MKVGVFSKHYTEKEGNLKEEINLRQWMTLYSLLEPMMETWEHWLSYEKVAKIS